MILVFKFIIIKINNFLESWLGLFVTFFFIIYFVIQSFRILSVSMQDDLLVGDMILVKKFSYGIPTPYIPFTDIPLIPFTDGHIFDGNKPKRGDVVVFRSPKDKKLHYIKRCVGLEGDLIFYKNKNLYIHFNESKEWIDNKYSNFNFIIKDNIKWIENPFQKEYTSIHNDDTLLKNKSIVSEEIFNMNVVRVEKGEYFMIGDNRDYSNDSRFWGTVKYNLIEGTPWIVWFSIDEDWNIRYERILKTFNNF